MKRRVLFPFPGQGDAWLGTISVAFGIMILVVDVERLIRRAAAWWSLVLFVILFGLGIFLVSFGRELIGDAKKQRRQSLGQCTSCGYDLRASKDKCPECGAAIPAKPAA